MKSGDALRLALAKGDPANAMARRRVAVEECLAVINADWRKAGKELSVAQRRKVASSLEAISAGAREGGGVELALSGTLFKDLEAPGLATFAGGVAAGKISLGSASAGGNKRRSAQAKRGSGPTQKKPGSVAERRAALGNARRKTTRLEKKLARLEAEAERVRAHVLRVQEQLEAAREQRVDVRQRVEQTKLALRQAREEQRGFES